LHTFICITVIVDTKAVQEVNLVRKGNMIRITSSVSVLPSQYSKLKAIVDSARDEYGVTISIQELLRDGLDNILEDMDVEKYLKNKGLI